MSFLSGIADFFRGGFNGDDDEERKRQERARQAAQRKQLQVKQPTPRPTNLTVNNEPKKQPQLSVAAPKVQPKITVDPKTAPRPKPQPAPRPTPTPPPDTRSFFNKVRDQIAIGDNKTFSNPVVDDKKRTIGETIGDKLEANSPEDIAFRKSQGREPLYQGDTFVGQVRNVAREIAKTPEKYGTSFEDSITQNQIDEIDKLLNDEVDSIRLFTEDGSDRGTIGNLFGGFFTRGTEFTAEDKKQLKEIRDKLQERKDRVPQYTNSGDPKDLINNAKNFIYGGEPVTSLQDDTLEAEKQAKDGTGVFGMLPEAQKQWAKENPKKAAQWFTGLSVGLDFVPFGAAGKAGKAATRAGKSADDVATTAVRSVDEIAETGARNADEVSLLEKEIRASIEDTNTPARTRRELQDQLNFLEETKKSIEDTKFRNAPENQTALEHSQNIQKVIDSETERFNDFVQGNPTLTRAEFEAAQEASKARTLRLVEELKESRRKNLGVVDEQGAELTKTVDDLAETNAEVATKQAEAAEPSAGNVVESREVPTDPEIAANQEVYQPDANVYSNIKVSDSGQLSDDLMVAIGNNIEQQARNSPLGKLFGAPARLTQAVTDPLSDLVNRGLTRGAASNNAIVSKISQLPRPIWSRFGMTDTARGSLDQLQGLKNTAQDVGLRVARRRNESIARLIEQGASPQEITRTLHQVFETPEFLARKYGDDVQKLMPEDLPPELKVIVDEQIDLNKIRNQINYQTGVIDEATYFQGLDGMHTPRLYGFDFTVNRRGGFTNNFDSTAGISRKSLDEIPDEIFDTALDPLTAQDVRFQQALVNKSRMDAIKKIKDELGAYDTPPNNGFTRLNGEQFGELDGMWVDNQVAATLKDSSVFKTGGGQKLDELLDVYRDSPLGTADRFVKQTKTVGSAGTHVGNIGSNATAFAGGAGVDPLTASARAAGGARSLVSEARGGFNPDIYALRKSGIISQDTGRALNGIPKKDVIKIESLLSEVESLAKTNPTQATKLLSRAWGTLQDVYGGTDDAFKIGIYRELRARGYSEAMAMRRVREQFQNYANAGHAIQMAADSPILGKPFARFIPELTRIIKNTVKNNPIGATAGLGGVAYLGNTMSEASGETAQERAERENAIGQTQLPGTSGINRFFGGDENSGNISLNFAVPDNVNVAGKEVDLPGGGSSVNVARATGLNFPLAPGGNPDTALAEQLIPVTVPVRQDKGGNTVFAPEETISSMTFNPIARIAANRDFMGRRITDPDNTVRWEGDGDTRYKYENPDGTPMDGDNPNLNRLRSLFMSYSPFSSEIDAVQAGVRGEEDYYGKERTPEQSILRMLGLKVEDNSPEARESRTEAQAFFNEELPEVQEWLRENPDLTDSYWKLKNTARDRNTEVSQNDIVSPERYSIIAADESGRLFNLLKEQHIARAKEEGTEIDPLYTLPQDQANEVIKLKSMHTGADTKFQQLLYNENWFKGYKDADKRYQENRPEPQQFPGQAIQNPRPVEWYALSEELYSPEGISSQYPLVQRYNDTLRQQFPGDLYDSDARKEFTKAWFDTYGDMYESQKQAYDQARLEIVNKMREIEGASPMSLEVWQGQFEVDEDSYGSGGGGSGYDPADHVNTLGNLTNFSAGVDRLDPVTAAAMPQLTQLFARLQAGSGGGKAKPKLGASSSGR